jgi:hypothetical protein
MCHRRPADDEDVGGYAAPHKPIAEGSERPFDLRLVKKDTARFGHAADDPGRQRARSCCVSTSARRRC